MFDIKKTIVLRILLQIVRIDDFFRRSNCESYDGICVVIYCCITFLAFGFYMKSGLILTVKSTFRQNIRVKINREPPF